jgi:addiction module HigA family antidote
MMVVLKNSVHPGEILKEEFLDELGFTAGKLAKALHVPRTRIERLVACKMGVSADTAFRLARYFGTTPEFWLNLQRGYDLAVTAQDTDLVDELETILPLAS